jgi:hypothetical protein
MAGGNRLFGVLLPLTIGEVDVQTEITTRNLIARTRTEILSPPFPPAILDGPQTESASPMDTNAQ